MARNRSAERPWIAALTRLVVSLIVLACIPVVLMLLVLVALVMLFDWLWFRAMVWTVRVPWIARWTYPTPKPAQRQQPKSRPEARAPMIARRPVPVTVSIHGSLFRYQGRDQLHRGEDFYRTFVDGPWKWRGHQRFAGVEQIRTSISEDEGLESIKLNTGHYFGTTSQSAEAEIQHYLGPADLADYVLLEVEGNFSGLLDLTDLDSIRAFADGSAVKGNVWTMLAELLEEGTGGGALSTHFGHCARTAGHSGILFFSARSILPHHADRMLDARYWDDVVEDIEKKAVLEDMQRREGGRCVTVFFGALLTSLIRRYRFDGADWELNPWHGREVEEIVKAWGEFGADFQAEQEPRVTFRATDV